MCKEMYNKVSPWRDVTLLARHVLLLVSYVAPWSVTDVDRRRQTHGEQSNTGPYTICRRASNKRAYLWRRETSGSDRHATI